MLKEFKISLIMLALFTALLGGVYPGLSTLIIQGLFPDKAQGSLIKGKDGHILGSSLIGQNFTQPKYFWGRLSATTPVYNAAASSGSNMGVNNPNLDAAVKARIDALQAVDPESKASIPVDLVTASGSGLDPEISPAAAEYQVIRVARARDIPVATVQKLVAEHTQSRQLGFLGEPRVNVLALNLALDGK